ncbi:NAD(P)H-quinone oxidoreductase [Shewanella sp. Isolate11]|uniref:NAD(P)H-quinone oxidoreductase n=1 Tax=Shewanella sp. Isolate11 TaxID=2908530 RepID=UPI001EFEB5DF|nr:NAD(P)H-quinone oxidoreductase [Shewanella sp. Isolate11]MCG9695596.1 NAD(P)H-quinone oxidoreductase [Shewanella sp. Isolate11]
MNIRCQQIHFDHAGGPDVLYLAEGEIPAPAPQQVMIKVSYAGVNGPDLAQRKGLYPPPPGASAILGLEVSGTIVAVGESVAQWQVGDTVCALVPGGGYSEYVMTWAEHCLPIPTGLSLAQAAALPETFFTLWGHLFMRGGLSAGDTLLLHGGSGGIGSAAIVLAKQFGVTVIVTSGSQQKCAYCLALGADYAFDYHTDWLQQVLAVAPEGVDIVLDMASGDMINLNLKALAEEGRLVTIALLRGATANVDVFRLMAKRITWTGATLRPQSVETKALIAKGLKQQVWPLFATTAGQSITPTLFAEFLLADAAQAHRLMESGQHRGKLVLKVAEDAL